MRVVSYIIDVVPAVICAWIISIVFAFIPVVGWIAGALLVPALVCAYQLFRDLVLSGSSVGKHFLKFKVISKKIMRNLDLAIPSGIQIIPVLGWMLGGLLGLAVIVTELIFLFTKGERLGDQWAGTKVIKVQ
jgi:uncharacterized membrane protein